MNPQLHQQTSQSQQGGDMKQQIYLQEQIYITQKNQEVQIEILKDFVCELKKER